MRLWSNNREIQAVGEAAEWAAIQADKASKHFGKIPELEERYNLILNNLKDLSTLIRAMDVKSSGSGNPNLVRVEDIPGRRFPFDFLTEIPIAANDTTTRQGTITVDQSGPFVAASRVITFLSQFQFSVTDPTTQEIVNFLGRSNGRFRPPHSAWDIMDGTLPGDVQRIVAMPGTGNVAWSSPSTHAQYRTMEGDFRIETRFVSTGFPRSNIFVPSTFWTTQITSPFPLASLDFLGKAEVVTISVAPQHVNNPPAGNIAGTAVAPYPFAASQFDQQEGVVDPFNALVGANDPDPVTRLPAGLVIAGFHGFRIQEPPGALTNIGAT